MSLSTETTTPSLLQHFPEIRWHGHWIWVPEEQIVVGNAFAPDTSQRPEAHGLFRKNFTLDIVSASVPARITADSRYLIFVNGQEVFRGPIRSQPRRMYYDHFDLAPYLQAGKNIIAIYVKYFGTPKSHWMPAVSNATLGKSGVMVFEAKLGESWLVSDGSWQARKSEAWSAGAYDDGGNMVAAGVPAEEFDARQLPTDWRTLDFDDSGWGAAQVITPVHIGGRGRSQPPTDPYGPLDPRPIAKLEGERFGVANVVIEAVDGPLDTSHNSPAGRAETSAVTQPASESQSASQLPITTTIPTNGYTRLILDMGRIVGGFVEFSLSAPEGYLRFQRMTLGGLVPDWDVENAIVIAEPFMSYVVHDAVAQAGMADRLPDLCKRWAEFLVDGYDTLGENWGTGTHVHGWSSTPAKDLVFYTLGVTPAEPGYTVARIAPRLGGLQWAKGSVPTPHGLIHVEVSSDQLTVDSPVPVTIAMPQDIPTYMVAGKYTFSLTETKQLVL